MTNLKRRTKLIIATVVGILMLCFSCALVIVPNEINSKANADTPAQVSEKKYKGGAVYVGANSTYKMTTGSITGHENLYGGAVYVASGGTFEMTGGEISGNSAKYGGAIYVAAGGKCEISGGIIKNNSAESAPAVYVEDGGELTVNDQAVIEDNYYMQYGVVVQYCIDGEKVTHKKRQSDFSLMKDNLPLSYEQCCGYFLDPELTRPVDFGEMFAEKLSGLDDSNSYLQSLNEYHEIKLYTRTATLDKLMFVEDVENNVSYVKALDQTVSGTVVIPSEYNNRPVEISEASNKSEGAFYVCTKINEVVLPSLMQTIPNYAFYNCYSLVKVNVFEGLKKINCETFCGCTGFRGDLILPESLEYIEYGAFRYCGFDGKLFIPRNVNYLGVLCFAWTNFQEVVVDERNQTFDSRNNCNAIVRTASNTLIHGFVTSVIDNSIVALGDQSFYHTRITSLYIPAGVSSIGFSLTGYSVYLTSIVVDENNSVYDSRDNCNAIIKTVSNEMVATCLNTVIPDGIVTIGENAFFGNSSIANITVPESVTVIRDGAFRDCEKITHFEIGSNVTTIGKGSFRHCRGLKQIFLSSSIDTIVASSYSQSPFFDCRSNTIIYTDVASESAIPSGWGQYWNYYAEGSKLTVVYGTSRAQYDSILSGLASFAPQTNEDADINNSNPDYEITLDNNFYKDKKQRKLIIKFD